MKIALCGAHGVGKTDLAKKLANHFNIPCIHGVAYSVAKISNIPDSNFLLSMPPGFIRDFQYSVWVNQIMRERSNPSFVSSHSVLDIAAYSEFFCPYSEWASDLKHKALRKVFGYDFLIYCPISQSPFMPDGFRLAQEHQETVDSIIQKYLAKLDTYPYILKLPPDKNLWLEMCVKAINEIGVIPF